MSWHWVQHTPSTTYTGFSKQRVLLTPSTAYTQSSIHPVQHTPSTAYPQYNIHRVPHTPSTAYTEYSTDLVQHTLSTVYTDYGIHSVQHTPSTAYTQYSIHPVQHTPSTAYTEYSIHRVQHLPKIICLPFILKITSWPLIVASASSVRPYTIDRHQPACQESSKVKSPCHIPTFASQLTDQQSLSTWLAVYQPPYSTCLISLNRGLQSVSPKSLDYGLQGHLQPRSITASNCISELARSGLAS